MFKAKNNISVFLANSMDFSSINANMLLQNSNPVLERRKRKSKDILLPGFKSGLNLKLKDFVNHPICIKCH